MPCYSPISGFRSAELNASGRRSIVFNPNQGYQDMPVTVACGQCIGCRLERSRQWAVRIMHEASLYERNCFLTLTFDDDHLPDDMSLNVSTFQKFMKRYRKECGKLRFFHCGEYGERYLRPHYHAIIFGHDFDDKLLFKGGSAGNLYVSAQLSKLWPFGFSTIGDVTFESAAYVARYVTKKVTGELADSHYQRVFESTGEIVNVAPEYTTMSRRPGIGKGWYDRFGPEVFPLDRVVVRGVAVKPPKFYDNLYEADNPIDFERVRLKRKLDSESKIDDNTWTRRLDREEFVKRKLNTFTPRKDF